MQEEITTPEQNPEPSPLRYGTVPPRRNGRGKKIFFFLVILLLIGGVISGFVFVSGRGGEEISSTSTPTEIPTATPTPAASPTPTGKLTPTPTEKPTATPTKKPTKNLTIRVLNGGGVAGIAKGAADYLQGLGYEIVGTGNAENFNFEKTTIEIKKAKESLLAQLKIDLETKYTLGTTSATLSATESADAIVTIGKK